MELLRALNPSTLPLSPYEKKISPVKGTVEQGLFNFLQQSLPQIPKFCIEFGAGNGTEHSQVGELIRQGWGALLIEADPKLYSGLKNLYGNSKNVKAVSSFITAENINDLFRDNGVPTQLGILCIDIDGMDWHVWEAIRNFEAVFVCIEYNASFGSREDFVVDYQNDFSWTGDDYFGASFASLLKLGQKKGYTLIHCTSDGDNMIFVKNEFLSALTFPILPAEQLFQWPKYGRNGRSPSGKGHPMSVRNSTYLERMKAKITYRATGLLRALLRQRK